MPRLPTHRRASIFDSLASILGPKNPHHHAVDPKSHRVWLFDNTAYRDGDKWAVEVVAAYFVKDSGEGSSEAVAGISEIMGITHEGERERVAQRLRPFMDSVLPSHTVLLKLDGQRYQLGPSSIEGISNNVVRFKSKAKNGSTIYPELVRMKHQLPLKPVTVFAEPEGWAVISDVDDTIKRTMTGSAIGVLRSTFVDDPEPIEGMPELYQHIDEHFERPPFWYLSASPYSLYEFLTVFRDNAKYPPGTFMLRDASWLSLAGLVSSVTQGTQAYKVDRMRKIHRWFPHRKIICFGDSTQSDPEAYGQIFRENEGWIAAIFIRKVIGVSEVEMDEEKNHPSRFERAFEGVPSNVWYVFEDPKEVYEKLNKLKEGAGGAVIK
jgi:phosphatidate phosphatase APP1